MRNLFAAALLLVATGCKGADAWTEEGDRLLRENQLEAAERAYERALEIDPHHAPAIYGKGWAYYASGYDELVSPARQLFQRAVDYGPDFHGGYRGLGVLLLQDGKIGPGEKYLREAYERAPTEPGVLESLGHLYLQAGRLAEARTLFQGAVDAAPDRGEFHRFLAEVAVAEKKWEEAFGHIEAGRASVVSGLRGTMALDEGETRIHLEFASHVSGTALGPDDPSVSLALRGLDRADDLLEQSRKQGLSTPDYDGRRRYHDEMRRRVEEVRKKVRP